MALVVKNPPANAGHKKDVDLIPGWGRAPEGEHGSPLQYSCLENPMDRGPWWATVHRVTTSLAQPKWLSTAQSSPSCVCARVTGRAISFFEICIGFRKEKKMQ